MIAKREKARFQVFMFMKKQNRENKKIKMKKKDVWTKEVERGWVTWIKDVRAWAKDEVELASEEKRKATARAKAARAWVIRVKEAAVRAKEEKDRRRIAGYKKELVQKGFLKSRQSEPEDKRIV